MFEQLTIRDARPILWMKRVFVSVIVALLLIGAEWGRTPPPTVREIEVEIK